MLSKAYERKEGREESEGRMERRNEEKEDR